ncbi:MAG: hypothetical protein EPN36_12110 [Rhodanobacteraceae bacterium]|nr:MAG: hypothetical protein EPN36_12110 [Rhodanobacteraceae bacterium]
MNMKLLASILATALVAVGVGAGARTLKGAVATVTMQQRAADAVLASAGVTIAPQAARGARSTATQWQSAATWQPGN